MTHSAQADGGKTKTNRMCVCERGKRHKENNRNHKMRTNCGITMASYQNICKHYCITLKTHDGRATRLFSPVQRLRRYEVAGQRYAARARQQHDDLWCFNRAGRTGQRKLEMSLDLGQLSEAGWRERMESRAEKWLHSFPGSLSPSRQTSLKDEDESDASEGAGKGENKRGKRWQRCTAAEQGTEGFSIQRGVLTLSLKTVNVCDS